MKDSIKSFIVVVLMFVSEMVVMLITGVLASSILVPIAYANRGVLAFGGEWVVIILAALIAAYVFDRYVSEPMMEGLQNEKQ